MMTDADKDYRNGARAGGHQRPATAHAGGRHHVATYVSRAPSSKLPAVLLGPTHLAGRHVDATNGDELVCLSNHEFKAAFGRRRRRGIRPDDVILDLGRLAR